MRTLTAVMLLAMAATMAGCWPRRVSVRSDGVLTIPGGIIYDPRTEKVQGLKLPGDGDILGMEWSPDGKRLLLISWSGGPGDGPHGYVWTEADGNFSEVKAGILPHWTPDGKGITYLAAEREEPESPMELKVTDIETGKVTELLGDILPFYCWDPKGKVLAAFELVRSQEIDDSETGLAQLVLLKGGEKEKAQLVVAYSDYPWITWSKDGKTILFTAPLITLPLAIGDIGEAKKKLQNEVGLYAFNVEAKRVARLTDRRIGYAEYSPDGKHILFVELLAEEKTRVGVMNADGTGVVDLDEGTLQGEGNPTSSSTNADGTVTKTTDRDQFGAVVLQPVWLTNTRVQYFQHFPAGDAAFGGMRAIDIDGKNKEDLGAKIQKLVDALPKDEPKKQ